MITPSQFELRNLKNKLSGTIEILKASLKKNLSFIDYLRCGVQLSLSIAIDFTGSNGPYTSPSSLHYMNPIDQNSYERAIIEVGSILEAYDTDKYFPVFGFGGILLGKNKPDHCFPLTFDNNDPYVQGVQGILNAYHLSLTKVTLSGPTLFSHIIDKTISLVSTSSQSVYYVLLIITDGTIMDMQETIASIVKASCLPLSIVIVGVGNAEFNSMRELDSDKGLLIDENGRKAVRDIVQFVPFKNFANDSVALAAEVLKEIPNQLTEFMKIINYFPVIVDDTNFSEMFVTGIIETNTGSFY